MSIILCFILFTVFPFLNLGFLSYLPLRLQKIQKVLSKNTKFIDRNSVSYSASNILLFSSIDSESILNDQEYLRMKEEAIQQLFEEQLEEDEEEEKNSLKFKHRKVSSSLKRRKTFHEPAVGLIPDIPLAFVKNRMLSFGNFRRTKENSSAIRIETVTGSIEDVDLSQIVEVWNDLNGVLPNDTLTWQNTINESLKQLYNLPPQKSHLEDFYRLLNDYQYNIPLSSFDLSVYLFEERKFKSWLTRLKRNEEEMLDLEDEDEDEDEDNEFEEDDELKDNRKLALEKVEIRKFTASERYIAAILLFYDHFHFHRRIPSKAYPEDLITPSSTSSKRDIARSSFEVDEDGNIRYHLNNQPLQLQDKELQELLRNSQTFIKGHGFKKQKYNIVRQNKLNLFYKYYNERSAKMKSRTVSSSEVVSDPSTLLSSSSSVISSLSLTPPLQKTSGAGSLSEVNSSISPANISSQSLTRLSDPHTAYLINYFVRMLELYAMSNQNNPPPLAKTILKKYRLPLTSEGATKLLINIGLMTSNSSFDSSSSSSSSGFKPVSSPTFFSIEMMKDIESVILDMKEKRGKLRTASLSKDEKVFGRKDLRSHSQLHPVFCLDTANSLFYDDAFSLSPESSEIFIHIVNSYEVLSKYSSLLDYAKQRLLTRFLPSGPIHMLPVPVLDSLKLSKEDDNDVITLALKVNYLSGEIYWNRYQIFPSIIGPITSIDIENANSMILDKIGIEEIPSSLVYNGQRVVKYKSQRPQVFSNSVVNDLLTVSNLVEKIVKREEWIEMDQKLSGSSGINVKKFETKVDPSTNLVRYIDSEHMGANRIVNTMLTIFSNRTYTHCYERRRIPVPIAYCNRNPRFTNLIRRFATSPLRNWIHFLQQQQLISSFYRLDNNTQTETENSSKCFVQLPVQKLSRDQCVASVKHYNSQSALFTSIINHNKVQNDFNELDSHFQKILQFELSGHFYTENGKELGIIEAEGTGNGGLVKLKGFNNLQAIAPVNIGEGEIVKVKVDDIDKIRKSIYVSLVDD
jgi:hypothetical protein